LSQLPPADILAIQQLYARYNHAIHAADGAAWAACFTDDGTFANRGGSHRGREALEAYGNEFSKAANARYWIDNLVLEPTPEGARGTCYLLILHVGGEGGPEISLTGVYADELVRVGAEWRFARRYVARDL
jgi:ketosteroid isomerase-like protein